MRRPFTWMATPTLTICLFGAVVFATPPDTHGVRNAVLAFSTTWNRHDMAAFGGLFARDADFVNVVGSEWKGRQDIQRRTAWLHGAIPRDTTGFTKSDPFYGVFKTSSLRFTQVEVRFLRDDVAVGHASWDLYGDAHAQQPRRGVLILVLTRQNGAWLIASAQNTELGGQAH